MCPGCYKALWSPFISKNRTRPHESHTQPRAVCVFCVCVFMNVTYCLQAEHMHFVSPLQTIHSDRGLCIQCAGAGILRAHTHTRTCFLLLIIQINAYEKNSCIHTTRLITWHHLKYRKYRIVCTLSVSTVDVKQKIVILSFSKQRLVNKQARVGYYYPTAHTHILHTRIHTDIKAGAVFITVPH